MIIYESMSKLSFIISLAFIANHETELIFIDYLFELRRIYILTLKLLLKRLGIFWQVLNCLL